MNKTSDNLEELFDIVNEKDEVIGQAKRGEVHGNPKLIHRSIGVTVTNNKGEIFLQQRSKTKDTDPLRWTLSCSGHVDSGNSFENAAHRELQEELGIDLDIKLVTRFIYFGKSETEMVTLFKSKSEGPFKLLKEEIVQGKFYTRNELKSQIKSGEIKLSKMGRICLEKIGWILK